MKMFATDLEAGVTEKRQVVGSLVRVGVVLAAIVAALAPASPSSVEAAYSTRVYPVLQRLLTPLSNAVPFALFDVLIAFVLLGWTALLIHDVRTLGTRGRVSVLGHVVARTATWTAVLYLLFLAVWGLNYRRVKLEHRMPFDAAAVTPAAAQWLAFEAADQLNALHGRAHATGWPPPEAIDPSLAGAFARAERELGVGPAALARPKPSLLDWYFKRAAVDGMTDPYFLETLVARDLLPFERPFVMAHEWGHLSGLADEGEANFLGWLACMHASEPSRYSGWMFLYAELVAASPPAERQRVQAKLQPGPRQDLQAIADRLARTINPQITQAGWRIYDRFLKANRVESGARSYAEVVRLVLGVKFGPDWTPQP